MERVLVCVVNSTRGHEVTFRSFKRHVLDELHADLALAIAVGDGYDTDNPYWTHAKYRWTVRDIRDFAEHFDSAQRALCAERRIAAPEWRAILTVGGIWLDRVGPATNPGSACGIALYCRWLLLRSLQENDLLRHYDRIIITRSDFVWLCPHPPLSLLDSSAIWIPEGEDYDGLADRHLVASPADAAGCLNLIEPVLLRPAELVEQLRHCDDWNSEMYLRHHLTAGNLLQKVRRFPNVAYLARDRRDDSHTWSRGRYEFAAGHFIKYDDEFDRATAMARIVASRSDWEKGEWRRFDPAAVIPQSPSMLSRAFDAWYRLQWALHRPGRAARLWRYCRRKLLRET